LNGLIIAVTNCMFDSLQIYISSFYMQESRHHKRRRETLVLFVREGVKQC
jgi:hypothetical protein